MIAIFEVCKQTLALLNQWAFRIIIGLIIFWSEAALYFFTQYSPIRVYWRQYPPLDRS